VPQASRPTPLHAQIASYYRERIASGELEPGTRLPSIRDLAEQWDVHVNTAAKAIDSLAVEGAVRTSTRGTYVSCRPDVAPGAWEIARGMPGLRDVREAGAVRAPDYVADLLGIEPGELVIRREEVVFRGENPERLTVDWIPATDVMEAAELTALAPVPGGLVAVVESATGQRVTHRQDHLEGRAADQREADALGVPVGSPVLAGAHVWSGGDRVLIYGEWCLAPRHVVTYESQSEA
jgi:GntR family transcriptional regulator